MTQCGPLPGNELASSCNGSSNHQILSSLSFQGSLFPSSYFAFRRSIAEVLIIARTDRGHDVVESAKAN